MKTYVTSDLHLGHVNMTEEGKDLCKRGFKTVPEMNEALLEGINSTVSSYDRLVVCGDLVMGKLEENIQLLADIQAAEIILLPGNHDRFSLAYPHKKASPQDWVARYELDSRFWVVPDQTPSAWHIRDFTDETAPDALISHYPYEGDHTSDDRYTALRAADEGLPIIHGHVHDSWRIRGRQFNVGVDVNDFKPVPLEELADWVRSL